MKRMMGCLLVYFLLTGTASGATGSIKCDPPYEPSNIVEILLFYSGTMKYLAHGPDACRFQFADEVRTIVKDNWLLWGGCVDATLEDIDNALAGNLKPQWRDDEKKPEDPAVKREGN